MKCIANISRRGSYCVFCGTIRSKSERPGKSRTEHDRMFTVRFVGSKQGTDAVRILHKLSLLEKKNLESVVEFLTASLTVGLSDLAHWPGLNRRNWLRFSPALT